MFATKEQEFSQSSSENILANIRKRLGIVSEDGTISNYESQNKKRQNGVNQKNEYNTQNEAGFHKSQQKTEQTNNKNMSNYQANKNTQTVSENFDDFSFDLNFGQKTQEQGTQEETSHVNKAYRAYQNTMRNQYNQEEEQSHGENQTLAQGKNQPYAKGQDNTAKPTFNAFDDEELSLEDETDFESENDELEIEDDAFEQESDESEYFETEENEYQEEEQGEYQQEGKDFANKNEDHLSQAKSNQSKKGSSSNREQNHQWQPQQQTSNSSQVFAQNIQTMLLSVLQEQIALWLNENVNSEAVQDEIEKWCRTNLENICRAVIKDELYKQK